MCGRCPKGTSELLFGTECTPNEECESKLFWVELSIFVLLYCLFFFFYQDLVNYLAKAVFSSTKLFPRRRPNLHTQSQSTETYFGRRCGGCLKIIFYYYQIVHIFISSVGEPGHALQKVRLFLDPIFNLLVSNLLFVKCPFKDLYPIQKTVILHSLGVLMLLFLGLLFVVWKIFNCFKRQSGTSAPVYLDTATGPYIDCEETTEYLTNNHDPHSSFQCRISSAFTHISLLMYASSANLCLTFLHCVPLADRQVLFIDGTVICFQVFHYFVLAYVVIGIVPFCLVPVLGSYLLAFDLISLTQFFLGCLFPLPLCCFWAMLLFKRWRYRNSRGYVAVSSQLDTLLGHDSIDAKNETTPRSAVLHTLLGPFRPQAPFLCFPELLIPWEGVLIFRRLVIILLFTFMYDVNLRMFFVHLACIIILVSHLYVKPFKRPSDNIMEMLSLSILVILSGITHIKAIYDGTDKSAQDVNPQLFNVISTIETVLIVAPLSVSLLIVISTVLYVSLARLLQLSVHLSIKIRCLF